MLPTSEEKESKNERKAKETRVDSCSTVSSLDIL